MTPVSNTSTPGGENFSFVSEVDSPAIGGSPVRERERPAMIARTSTPRGTPGRAAEPQADGDDKLKNFFQSLLVNKGK